MDRRKSALIIPLALVLIIVLAFNILYPKSKYKKPEINISNTPKATITISPSPQPTINVQAIKLNIPKGWKTFVSEKYRFAIGYPDVLRKTDQEWPNETWSYSEETFYDRGNEKQSGHLYWLGFGPPKSIPGGMVWGMGVYKNEEIENIISDIGRQFEDRKEIRQRINVNGIDAILVTVTTNRYGDWIGKVVIIQNKDLIYTIENGAQELEEFNDFYQSFRLL